MGRTTLTAAAAAVLIASFDPAPAPVEALPPWVCNAYCRVMYYGCNATLGQLDPQLCEDWYEGCRVGCRVSDDNEPNEKSS